MSHSLLLPLTPCPYLRLDIKSMPGCCKEDRRAAATRPCDRPRQEQRLRSRNLLAGEASPSVTSCSCALLTRGVPSPKQHEEYVAAQRGARETNEVEIMVCFVVAKLCCMLQAWFCSSQGRWHATGTNGRNGVRRSPSSFQTPSAIAKLFQSFASSSSSKSCAPLSVAASFTATRCNFRASCRVSAGVGLCREIE